MRRLLKTLLPAAAMVVGISMAAEAAPAGAGMTPLHVLPEASSLVEKTYWVRRCHYTRYGYKCHRVWVKPRHHRRHYRHRHYRRW